MLKRLRFSWRMNISPYLVVAVGLAVVLAVLAVLVVVAVVAVVAVAAVAAVDAVAAAAAGVMGATRRIDGNERVR